MTLKDVSDRAPAPRFGCDRTMSALRNTCVFTFVNVVDQLQLVPVPEVYPTTYLEDARYLSAYRRSKLRRVKKLARKTTVIHSKI